MTPLQTVRRIIATIPPAFLAGLYGGIGATFGYIGSLALMPVPPLRAGEALALCGIFTTFALVCAREHRRLSAASE